MDYAVSLTKAQSRKRYPLTKTHWIIFAVTTLTVIRALAAFAAQSYVFGSLSFGLYCLYYYSYRPILNDVWLYLRNEQEGEPHDITRYEPMTGIFLIMIVLFVMATVSDITSIFV